ncbi:MAG TPA: hypothetical protein DCS17_02650 [Flavobacterium sp.]|nr:hypothetical protein [Flavobacterium sp.]
MLLKLIIPRLIPKAFGSGQCWRMKSVKNHYQRFQPLVLEVFNNAICRTHIPFLVEYFVNIFGIKQTKKLPKHYKRILAAKKKYF